MQSSQLSTIAATASILCLASSLAAQAPVNDECINAIAVTVGTTPFDSTGATTNPADPVWPCAVGGSDIWYMYTATASGTVTADTCTTIATPYDTAIEIFDGTGGCGGLVSLMCNDDSCSLRSSVNAAAMPGSVFYIRVGGYSGATGLGELNISFEAAFDIVGAAEATPNTATLSTGGQSFGPGDLLRWNLSDPNGLFPGNIAAVALNLGQGTQAIGSTPLIPGLEILWAGSTPAGQEYILPPVLVGAPDFMLTFPAWFMFAEDDSVRIQGLVLDLASPNALPVTVTRNAITFLYTTCNLSESFEGLANGIGQYPVGWSNGGGIREWSANTGGTGSSGTGPTAAAHGSQYMYTETSTPATGTDTFILNSDVYPASAAPTGTVEFFLSRVGATMGALEVRLGDGTGTFPTVLATYPAATNTTNEWDLETLTGLPTTGNMQLQFLYTYGGGFTGDCAIDKVCFK